MNDSLLFNFRMPVEVKHKFEQHCIGRNVSMTSQLNILIAEYMRTESADCLPRIFSEEIPLSLYIQV